MSKQYAHRSPQPALFKRHFSKDTLLTCKRWLFRGVNNHCLLSKEPLYDNKTTIVWSSNNGVLKGGAVLTLTRCRVVADEVPDRRWRCAGSLMWKRTWSIIITPVIDRACFCLVSDDFFGKDKQKTRNNKEIRRKSFDIEHRKTRNKLIIRAFRVFRC